MPLLSVVIPLHGNLTATQEMYRSLLDTLPDDIAVEIIFVDDASPDDTPIWLRGMADKNVHCVFFSANAGFAKASNAGARRATGRYLLMANNDLVYKPGWLEPMLGAFHQYGNNLGLLGNVQERVIDGAIDHAGIRLAHDGSLEHVQTVLSTGERCPKAWAVTGACFMMRRDDFNTLGGFDEAYVNGSEDVDLCLKVKARGMDVRVALDSRILHHVSLTRKHNSIQNENNSRRLQATWLNDFRVELVAMWADWLRNNQRSEFAAHFDGEPTPYAQQLPLVTAARIADNMLSIKQDHWRHAIDGGKDPGVDQITQVLYGTYKDPESDAQCLVSPDFDIEIRGVSFIRRLFILGHIDGLPKGSEIRVVVNGMQAVTLALPEHGNFRCSVRGLVTIPGAPNILECKLNLSETNLHKIRITGIAFKAISAATGVSGKAQGLSKSS